LKIDRFFAFDDEQTGKHQASLVEAGLGKGCKQGGGEMEAASEEGLGSARAAQAGLGLCTEGEEGLGKAALEGKFEGSCFHQDQGEVSISLKTCRNGYVTIHELPRIHE
jgi:hypothetical protein